MKCLLITNKSSNKTSFTINSNDSAVTTIK